MLDLQEALAILRPLAALDGEHLPSYEARLCAALGIVLAHYQMERDDLDRLQKLLDKWGIPTKQRKDYRQQHAGFEKGWVHDGS